MRVTRLTAIEFLRRLGWPGACGAALLVLAAGYGLLVLLPVIEARGAAFERASRAEARLARIHDGGEPVPEAPGQQLASFHESLPAQEEATDAINRIYAAAAAEGVTLARGEYALEIDPETRLARYQMLLPVRGGYLQLRRFLNGALVAVPALSLEDIDFQRKQISDGELEGRVRMALYLSRR